MSGGVGSPPIRAPEPVAPSPGLKPVPGRPHIFKDEHGRLHNLTPTPCGACGNKARVCIYCGRGIRQMP